MTECNSLPDTWDHINEVRQNLRQISTVLIQRGLNHDLSKTRSPEVEILNEAVPKLKDLTYGSEEYNKALGEMKVMTDHHYANNDHHPEFHANGIYSMTLIQLIEMLADWKAASLRHKDGDIEQSIILNAKRFDYDENMTNILLNTVKSLGWV